MADDQPADHPRQRRLQCAEGPCGASQGVFQQARQKACRFAAVEPGEAFEPLPVIGASLADERLEQA